MSKVLFMYFMNFYLNISTYNCKSDFAFAIEHTHERYEACLVEGDKFIDIFIISVIIQTLCVQILHGRYQ